MVYKNLLFSVFFFICASCFAEALPEVTLRGFEGSPKNLTDLTLLQEQSRWNDPQALISRSVSDEIVLDYKSEKKFVALALQADWNDTYIIESSIDGTNWIVVSRIPAQEGRKGLITQTQKFSEGFTARFIRIRGGLGDGTFSISRALFFEKLPTSWAMFENPPKTFMPAWFPAFSAPRVEVVKQALITLALVLFVLELFCPPSRKRRLALCALTLISIAAWSNFFQFHYHSFVHRHEFFHYYLGSKYSPELGYTRLYECTVAADKEDSFSPGYSAIRNLSSNTIQNISELNSSECTKHFSKDRWLLFKKDLSWFRSQLDSDEYARVLKDHGYNATIVWNLIGYSLSNMAPISTAFVSVLSWIDPILMIIAFVFCFKSFGLIPTASVIIFWGCNYLASFSWTGGAFLRADWLAALLIGVSLLKQKRFFTSGVALSYAGLARIFPFSTLAVVGIGGIVSFIFEKKWREGFWKVVLGSCVSVFLLAGVSIWSMGGTWHVKEFIHNTEKHFKTYSTNFVGIKSLLNFDTDSTTQIYQDPRKLDPFEDWKKEKNRLEKSRSYIFVLVALLYLSLIIGISRNAELWELACLGVTLILFINLSNYDYYALMPLALLSANERSKYAGLGLIVLGCFSWLVPQAFKNPDEVYAVFSLLTCIYGVFVALSMIKSRTDS